MDDLDSIEEASPRDQINFWSLTFSFMLKLLAVGLTIFILPFNEWIILENETNIRIIRGISGSDCINIRNEHNSQINCIKWDELDSIKKADFWIKQGIPDFQVQHPSYSYVLIYYILLIQIIIYIMDLIATLAMCCRYKNHNNPQNPVEKIASIIFSTIILFLSFLIILFVLMGRYDFLGANYNVSCGLAFKLFLLANLIYIFGQTLSNILRLTDLYRQEKDNLNMPQRLQYVATNFLCCKNTYSPQNQNDFSRGLRLQNRLS